MPICPVLENALQAPNLNYGHQKVAKLVTAAAAPAVAGSEPVLSCVVASPILGIVKKFLPEHTNCHIIMCGNIYGNRM